jgi:spore maturation protein CgeB
MRVALFVHSLLSDWNHGNAHFLRGVATELDSRGHDVRIFEPRDAWSLQNLLADDPQRGEKALEGFHRAYPALTS